MNMTEYYITKLLWPYKGFVSCGKQEQLDEMHTLQVGCDVRESIKISCHHVIVVVYLFLNSTGKTFFAKALRGALGITEE
mmetsp:Transcript_23132/g.64979  ORF Transcript_23132/g.64979 Transcript_23132/m.64979 type:complete len:80 (+) Transcript_23132:58-297(+)